jgi:hypothetical protein
MVPPPPPARPSMWGNVSQFLSALALIGIALASGKLALDASKPKEPPKAEAELAARLQEGMRAQADALAKLQEGLRQQADALNKLQESLRVEAELGRTTAALAAYKSLVESRRFEIERGLSCVAFIELLSHKPNFDAFGAEPDRKFSKAIYAKAVFDIEQVNYATKGAEHPITKELKACVAPGPGQERIAFPDELSALVFRDGFDAQIDPIFNARFNLVFDSLANLLTEYASLAPPARKLIEQEIGDAICNSAVGRLDRRKADSATIRAVVSAGSFARVNSYVSENCRK